MFLRRCFRLHNFLPAILLPALLACTPVPTDPQTGALFTKMSERDDAYFAYLIRSYGTNDCRPSSKESEKYWKATDGDLAVIDARLRVLDEMTENAADFSKLNNNYNSFKALMIEREKNPGRVDGKLDHCLDPETVADSWVKISRLSNAINQNVVFE